MARVFYPTEHFAPAPQQVNLLPFRFTRLAGQELLVNEAGEYLFAPEGTTRALADGATDTRSDLYKDLKAKHIVYDGTKLHIFVVTLRCEHSCHYCQVSRQTATKGEFDMSEATADRSIALMFDSPSPHVTMELQGGEPLLAFDMIQYMVPKAKEQARLRGKGLEIVVTTNLACEFQHHLMALLSYTIRTAPDLETIATSAQ
jgi:sulfatase maturation enzyme AslB (radical SAM superfamily)